MTPRPVHPCRLCTSPRFAHVPSVLVLSPFLSRARQEKQAYKRDRRSGEALVCLGCGHVDYFVQAIDTLLMQSGVTEVRAESEGPYR
jgi:hypothetical protein